MRTGALETSICGVPCEIVYLFDPGIPMIEPPEARIDGVRDQHGRVATWLERKLGAGERQRIIEAIIDRERT